MDTNYSAIVSNHVKRKEEKYNMNELFKKPLIHRQIKGEKVYIPLDPKRLWGY